MDDAVLAWFGLLLGLTGSGFILSAVIRLIQSVRTGLR